MKGADACGPCHRGLRQSFLCGHETRDGVCRHEGLGRMWNLPLGPSVELPNCGATKRVRGAPELTCGGRGKDGRRE